MASAFPPRRRIRRRGSSQVARRAGESARVHALRRPRRRRRPAAEEQPAASARPGAVPRDALGRGAARRQGAPAGRSAAQAAVSDRLPYGGGVRDLARDRRAGAVGRRRAFGHSRLARRPPGGRDRGRQLAGVRRRLARVPQGRLVTIADAGHMLHHDQPDAVAATSKRSWPTRARRAERRPGTPRPRFFGRRSVPERRRGRDRIASPAHPRGTGAAARAANR